MGLFDDYAGVQLKIGDADMASFQVGDTVPIPDGVYLGWEGVIVVQEGRLLCAFQEVVTKWGQPLSTERVLKALQGEPSR